MFSKGDSLKVIEELSNLIKIQDIDSQIISLKNKLELIPAEINKLNQTIVEIDKQFNNEQKKLTDLEKQKRDKERQIEDLNEKIKKLKERTSQIKTNKEYQALLKEIEEIEREIKKQEDNLLIILYNIDETKNTLNEVKLGIESRKREINIKKKELEEQINILNQQIEVFKDSRKQLISKIPIELYDEYRELMKKHKGLAVSEVKNSVCQGCFLHIPPQLYVEIKINQSIYHCPQCGRFLYYRNEDKLEETKVQAE